MCTKRRDGRPLSLVRLGAICLLCFSGAGCLGTTIDASYDDATDAIAAGMVEKGWIPVWIPNSAVNLHEVHDLDTSVSELSFEIPDAAKVRLPVDCEPVKYSDTIEARIRRGWWPDEKELRESFSFLGCNADAADYKFVGIRRDGRRILQWRTYGK